MKVPVGILLICSLMVTVLFSGSAPVAHPANVQNNSTPDPAQLHHHYKRNLPADAIPGSTAQRKAAFDSLTPEHRKRLAEKIRPWLQQARQQAAQMEKAGDYDDFWSVSLSDRRGNSKPQVWRRMKKGEPSLLQSAALNTSRPPIHSRSASVLPRTSDAKDGLASRSWFNHATGSAASLNFSSNGGVI